MKNLSTRLPVRLLGLAAAGWLCQADLVTTVEAVVGAPATPVSYAGVARRSPVGVGSPGVGAGAPGVGVTPGVGSPGVGAPGVGVTPDTPGNKGGPVNRVGRR